MARKLARELGVDLAAVKGTGPGGRITKEDVEKAASAPTPAAAPVAAAGSVPVRGMRKTIAERMHDSLQSMAQLTMDMDVNMDDAVKLRNQLVEEWADEGIKPTYTDLVTRAADRPVFVCPSLTINVDFDACCALPPGYRTFQFAPDGSIASTCYLLDRPEWPRTPFPDGTREYLDGHIDLVALEQQTPAGEPVLDLFEAAEARAGDGR